MANIFYSRFRIFVTLLTIPFCLILGLTAVEASQLKDIRVGEYDDFTRVVFELADPVSNPQITSVSGRLSVSFDNTEADLSRKIPVERSKIVEDIQIWQRKNNLSIIIIIDYRHFRFEAFPLNNPPRIAVDIFPIAAPPLEDTAGTDAAPENIEDPRQPEQAARITQEEDMAASVEIVSPQVERAQPQPPATDTAEAAAPVLFQQPQEDSNVSHQTTVSGSNLVFYLIVMLVTITIIILLLLLLMLLARHRLSGEKAVLKASEYLQHQDKKIAALNSRIKEQFKRYEEA